MLPSIIENKRVSHKPMFFAADTLTPEAVRYGVIQWPWKLVREEHLSADAGSKIWEFLFNLEQDPQEQHDLGGDQVEILVELNQLLADWKDRAPQHELRFNNFPHPGWAPPTDWNNALIDTPGIDVSFSKDKRLSQSLKLRLRDKLVKWLDDSGT